MSSSILSALENLVGYGTPLRHSVTRGKTNNHQSKENKSAKTPVTSFHRANSKVISPLAVREAELKGWKPPKGSTTDIRVEEWPIYLDHGPWLEQLVLKYHFEDIGELLRHLIFQANSESGKTKKLIFKVIRCLHCHQGVRAGSIPKEVKVMPIFEFYLILSF